MGSVTHKTSGWIGAFVRACVVVGLAPVWAGCAGHVDGQGGKNGAADLSVLVDESIETCASGTAPLSYFTSSGLGVCHDSYADAVANLQCNHEAVTTCAGYNVVGDPGPFLLYDCYYDAGSGALVGAWYFTDGGVSCVGGGAHAQCNPSSNGGASYPPVGCVDGGT
jgi:hypothetical protein